MQHEFVSFLAGSSLQPTVIQHFIVSLFSASVHLLVFLSITRNVGEATNTVWIKNGGNFFSLQPFSNLLTVSHLNQPNMVPLNCTLLEIYFQVSINHQGQWSQSQSLHLFLLGALLCNLIKQKKLDIGQKTGEAVKVDKKKIQSRKRDTELLMGSYTEALSLNWCDLRPDESLCWSLWSPSEFMAANHSPRFVPLSPIVPHDSNNKSVLAPMRFARDLVLTLNPS